jgi:hypothetical protein
MKKPPLLPSDPNAQCELEIARRRAQHHCRDSGRILTEVMHLVPFQDRAAYTKIVGALQTAERQLIDLKPGETQ